MRVLLALLLLGLAAPALAQRTFSRIYYVVCDPADPRTMDGAHLCTTPDPPRPVARPTDRDTLVRLYADLARRDAAAVDGALDDHVTWTGPAGRLFGRAAVGRHLGALAPAEILVPDAAGRIVAIDAAGTATAWRLLDGRVLSAEQDEAPRTANVPHRRTP